MDSVWSGGFAVLGIQYRRREKERGEKIEVICVAYTGQTKREYGD